MNDTTYRMKRVLILCTGNSCRSQMAEALWRHLGGDRWEAFSAGSKPAGYIHPLAIKAMTNIGVDISGLASKHVDEFAEADFDVVVTVCDGAKEACPTLPGAKSVLHWPFENPAQATGTDAEKLAVSLRVRDEIRGHIADYLAV